MDRKEDDFIMTTIIINELSAAQVKEMFVYVGQQVIDSKPLLTKIDGAIGDGDHGIGMSVGFTKVIENLNSIESEDVIEIFKTIGMSMISSMGGASGVIFGTMFVGGVKNLEPRLILDLPTLQEIFSTSLEAIKQRGKADYGDKTMIDAFQPAIEALKESVNGDLTLLEGLIEAENASIKGVEASKNYIAKFGRAKSLGERAIGHQDAGATTVSIIFTSMREWVEAKTNG